LEDIYKLQVPRDDLHEQLGKGFPKGSIALVEGPFGAGKSAVLQRMAYGFLCNGHSVTLISTEQTVRDFISQMYSLDYGISSHLLSGRLLFIPVYPLIGKAKDRRDFLSMLTTARDLFEKDIIMIDTLSSLVSNSIGNEEGSVRILSFFKKLAGMGKTIILSVDPAEIEERLLVPFRSDSHIYLTLVVSQVGGIISRAIVVKRFGGTQSRVAPIIGFRIEPNVGMVIEITSVV